MNKLTTFLEEMKKVGENATPGPWSSHYHNRTESWAITYQKIGCDGVNDFENVIAMAPSGESK